MLKGRDLAVRTIKSYVAAPAFTAKAEIQRNNRGDLIIWTMLEVWEHKTTVQKKFTMPIYT